MTVRSVLIMVNYDDYSDMQMIVRPQYRRLPDSQRRWRTAEEANGSSHGKCTKCNWMCESHSSENKSHQCEMKENDMAVNYSVVDT